MGLPLGSTLDLRRSWPKLGHFVLGDMSMHGFDYWPEQITEFQELYPHGNVPQAAEVFTTEFGAVLATQYGKLASSVWSRLEETDRNFWDDVAQLLPRMRRSEVALRVNELFP